MASITTCYVYLSTAASLPRQIICSWAIMWIGANSRLKRYVFSSLTRLNTRRTFSFFVATMNVQVSIESTDSMMNVWCSLLLPPLFHSFSIFSNCCVSAYGFPNIIQANEGTILSYGKRLRIVLTVSLSPPSSTRKYSPCTAVCHPTSPPWNKSDASCVPPTSQIPVCPTHSAP